MTTYILSQNPNTWTINRHSDGVSPLASGISSEEDALAIALSSAKKDTPSQIVRITLTGDSRVIATFDIDREN